MPQRKRGIQAGALWPWPYLGAVAQRVVDVAQQVLQEPLAVYEDPGAHHRRRQRVHHDVAPGGGERPHAAHGGVDHCFQFAGAAD